MTPVTILTGFLGAGKTTLLNRILDQQHGRKIAVIENEFGAAGVDAALLRNSEEQIVEMNNGCICCSVRGDLLRILADLAGRRARGEIDFERVIIETTGLAAPAPVAQSFFVDDEVGRHYRLDAILTVVDAVHGQLQLDRHAEAQQQVGFADRILVTKSELVQPAALAALHARLHRLNARAPIAAMPTAGEPLVPLLDIGGFNLSAMLDLAPDFLDDTPHQHDDSIGSFVFRASQPFVTEQLEDFLGAVLQLYAKDLMRYKGVLYVDEMPARLLFQGVHMMTAFDAGPRWQAGEKRESVLVFIGRDLPREMILRGLAKCLKLATDHG